MLRLHVHPENPQPRLIQQAATALKDGQIAIMATDACYVLCCQMNNKTAVERIMRLRGANDKYQHTLLCQDVSQLSHYATVENHAFRAIKSHLPNATQFILPATKAVPKHLVSKQKTIALRISDYPLCQMLLEQLGEPMLISTLQLADSDEILSDPEEIAFQLEKLVDVFLDSSYGLPTAASIVDLSDDHAHIVRYGISDVSAFE
ncbi:MAG: L-threonylcarbamoyladenylate synthase [Acinetobacter sp.]|nr:L-threonylcarbamoyladenylate synthase [Acinetobacter sp.]